MTTTMTHLITEPATTGLDMQKMEAYFLVADIGGTNARFAWVAAGDLSLHDIATYSVKDHDTFESAVESYLQDHNIQLLSGACIAIAGPVAGGEARLTNGLWHIRREQFCEYFSCSREHFWLINDFVAQSMAVPFLSDQELGMIEGGNADPEASVLVVGPGTGLGAGLLVKTAQGWHPCPGEGGHMDFAPASEIDISVWRYLVEELGRVPCWEDVLSGYGLELLYAAHTSIKTGAAQKLAASEITDQALTDASSLQYAVVQHFLELLARYAGNLAAATGAKGGVYLAGGIVPRIKDLIDDKAFRQAFEQRGKMHGYMETIPVRVVLAQQPGLTGSAAYLQQSLALNC